MRRILAALVAVPMILTAMPVAASAAPLQRAICDGKNQTAPLCGVKSTPVR